MALGRVALLLFTLAFGTTACPARTGAAPAPSAPAYTWIFFGILPATLENFSGTLVASAAGSDFEMALADGVTCDGTRLEDLVGLVKLHELTCSDGRSMHAVFVSQGGTELRVFGRIGEEEFIVDAHLLDFDAPDEGVARTLWPPALPPVPAVPSSPR